MKKDCPFCQIIAENERDFLYRDDFFVAFYDKYPVNEGHTLLIPRKHLKVPGELPAEKGVNFFRAINDLREFLKEKYDPAGFNIGLNENTAAGQSIEHLHWHLIPRYPGDVEEPLGGVRGVIPDKQKY
ncbi:MAG: HIT family protein [bacterium]